MSMDMGLVDGEKTYWLNLLLKNFNKKVRLMYWLNGEHGGST